MAILLPSDVAVALNTIKMLQWFKALTATRRCGPRLKFTKCSFLHLYIQPVTKRLHYKLPFAEIMKKWAIQNAIFRILVAALASLICTS